ncbi:MAG: pitrilysin family protein [Sphingomonadales bacterium]
MIGPTTGRFLHSVLVAAFLVAAPFAAVPLSAANNGVEAFTLRNGMEVVVIPDHRAPIVTHMVWYRVGSADEPVGRSGIAHFLEHLMFKRTRTLEDGEFSRIVAQNGGRHNAFASYDFTGYYQNVARDRLELMMKLEADRMVNLRLRKEDIASERDVIIEERRMRVDNNPAAMLNEQMMATLFHRHPYGTPVIGWLPEMQGLDLDFALEFYRDHYTPSNAVLIVAGDVTVDEVRILAKRHYGRIRSREVTPRSRPAEPPAVAPRQVELSDPRVRQPGWNRLYLAPGYHRAEPGEAEALAVLGEILGGSPTSRLYRRLVVESEVATDAGAWYQGTAYDLGRVGVYASPLPEEDPERAREALMVIEREVEAIVADIVENGISDAELDRTRRKLVADSVYARDSIASMAQMYGRALTTGSTVEDVNEWPDRIMEVTAEDVHAAARKVFDVRGSVTGLLLPEPEAESGQ